MSIEADEAVRVLSAIENGTMQPEDAANRARDLDPVYVWAITEFVRDAYSSSHPAAAGVLDRLVRMTGAERSLVRKHKDGEADPIAAWFRSEYSWGDFRGRGAEMIGVLADKLES